MKRGSTTPSCARGQWNQALKFPGSVESELGVHRDCRAGYGNTQMSCGRRAYLMEIRAANQGKPGWDFDIPGPREHQGQ